MKTINLQTNEHTLTRTDTTPIKHQEDQNIIITIDTNEQPIAIIFNVDDQYQIKILHENQTIFPTELLSEDEVNLTVLFGETTSNTITIELED